MRSADFMYAGFRQTMQESSARSAVARITAGEDQIGKAVGPAVLRRELEYSRIDANT